VQRYVLVLLCLVMFHRRVGWPGLGFTRGVTCVGGIAYLIKYVQGAFYLLDFLGAYAPGGVTYSSLRQTSMHPGPY
jgi:hypothetical protein